MRWDWLWIPMLWLISLILSTLYAQSWWGIPIFLVRLGAHTGLFILAHDAMHGSLFPGRPGWNRRLGSLALGLYACLPFERCCQLHQQHHALTGANGDPDTHHNRSFWGWYAHFMAQYVSLAVCIGLVMTWIGWIALLVGLGWTGLPILIYLSVYVLGTLLGSSLQLFFFGTYLPHRGNGIRTYPWPRWLSALACYHFGYHQEHHCHPHQPWYRLPSLYTRFTESEEYVKLHESILINELWLQSTSKNGPL